MIKKWEIIEEEGKVYLITDGTKADAKIMAKKLDGVSLPPEKLDNPEYNFYFELIDPDAERIEKIKVAAAEAAAQTGKATPFIPGTLENAFKFFKPKKKKKEEAFEEDAVSMDMEEVKDGDFKDASAPVLPEENVKPEDILSPETMSSIKGLTALGIKTPENSGGEFTDPENIVTPADVSKGPPATDTPLRVSAGEEKIAEIRPAPGPVKKDKSSARSAGEMAGLTGIFSADTYSDLLQNDKTGVKESANNTNFLNRITKEKTQFNVFEKEDVNTSFELSSVDIAKQDAAISAPKAKPGKRANKKEPPAAERPNEGSMKAEDILGDFLSADSPAEEYVEITERVKAAAKADFESAPRVKTETDVLEKASMNLAKKQDGSRPDPEDKHQAMEKSKLSLSPQKGDIELGMPILTVDAGENTGRGKTKENLNKGEEKMAQKEEGINSEEKAGSASSQEMPVLEMPSIEEKIEKTVPPAPPPSSRAAKPKATVPPPPPAKKAAPQEDKAGLTAKELQDMVTNPEPQTNLNVLEKSSYTAGGLKTQHQFYGARQAAVSKIDHTIELQDSAKHSWPLEVPLVPTYTFDSMIIGANRFAHATAISIIENPGKLYNPFVLHGHTGTGKTHFLNAIGFALSKKFGQQNIFLTNGVRFSRGIQRYAAEKNIEKFQKFMSNIQALLIDDIHLTAVNEQNREYISNCLKDFLAENKQIVITSKYPPESLNKLESLINFRLDTGWVSELKEVTGENHTKIVRKLLHDNDITLSDAEIQSFFSNMSLSAVSRTVKRVKVLATVLETEGKEVPPPAALFDKLLAVSGEDMQSVIAVKDFSQVEAIPKFGKGEWGRVGFFYPTENSNMFNWMAYSVGMRGKELGISGSFDLALKSAYNVENIISAAFKIANICDQKKLKGAVILGPSKKVCDPAVRENFYDILTHMLEIMLIRCGIVDLEHIKSPSSYAKVVAELLK